MSVSRLDREQPVTVVSPRTGEVLTIDAPTGDLAGFLADVREHESVLREAKNYVQAEILRRQDANANWTDHLEGFKFDELALRSDLLALVDEGVVTAEAVDKAVEPVVTYKARKSGITALRKLGGRVAAIVDAHANEVAKRRYVKVERA